MAFNHPLMANNIDRKDLDAVIEFLETDNPRLTNGPMVERFEKAWAQWLDVEYCVFVSSGSAANFITIQALKLLYPNGGSILVPPLTWVSDISAVLHHGFDPVFVDIDLSTLSMNSELVADSIRDDTVAVFITHAQGFNGLTDDLLALLKERNILLIEDVCESHGATHNDKKLGTFGFASNFSFFYAHHMSTIEGGMICCNDQNFYQICRALRSHGMVRESNSLPFKQNFLDRHPDLNPDFIFLAPAFNFRNTEIGAVIGLSQLPKLDLNNGRRIANYRRFYGALDAQKFVVDFRHEGSCNYAFQIILQPEFASKVDSIMRMMDRIGIEFRRGSAGGGNQLRQPYLNHLAIDFSSYPVVEYVHKYGFYIGNYPSLSFEKIDWLISAFNAWDDD